MQVAIIIVVLCKSVHLQCDCIQEQVQCDVRSKVVAIQKYTVITDMIYTLLTVVK